VRTASLSPPEHRSPCLSKEKAAQGTLAQRQKLEQLVRQRRADDEALRSLQTRAAELRANLSQIAENEVCGGAPCRSAADGGV
jgi:hypothetical protein